jgi:hypothetical protein
MTLFRLSAESIVGLDRASFRDLGITERGDLQRILRDHISVIVPDALVISEEFSSWDRRCGTSAGDLPPLRAGDFRASAVLEQPMAPLRPALGGVLRVGAVQHALAADLVAAEASA